MKKRPDIAAFPKVAWDFWGSAIKGGWRLGKMARIENKGFCAAMCRVKAGWYAGYDTINNIDKLQNIIVFYRNKRL